MKATATKELAAKMPRHPNDLDRKRIEYALKERKRYRYVLPRVLATDGGYRIESPCCSRNVDAEGGIVDVALIEYREEADLWHLYRKNHMDGTWEFHSTHGRLHELVERLNSDVERKFWQ
ncbi:MAG: hypothetical protein H5U13_08905 [Parvibaculum sp.]|nr:hypothetical protein [Parvibaculum sp.]